MEHIQVETLNWPRMTLTLEVGATLACVPMALTWLENVN